MLHMRLHRLSVYWISLVDSLLLVLVERLTDQLELLTIFKEVIRLELAGLLVSVHMDRTLFF